MLIRDHVRVRTLNVVREKKIEIGSCVLFLYVCFRHYSLRFVYRGTHLTFHSAPVLFLLVSFLCVLDGLIWGSCIPLAAGAAGGYFMHKEGYRFQSPVKKGEKPAPRAEMVVPEG